MDYGIRLLAKHRGHIKVESGSGLRHTVFVGDRRYSKNNRAYIAMKGARSIMRDIEVNVFGEDARWFQASRPPGEYVKKLVAVGNAISACS